jgi:hypothetical protein
VNTSNFSMTSLRQLTIMAASLSLMACTSDQVVGPSIGGTPGSISLSVIGSASLASLGDTATIRPRLLDVGGSALAATDIATAPVRWSMSTPGILEQVGTGVFRAVRNGRVTVIAEIDPAATGIRPSGYYATRLVDSVTIEVRQQPANVTATFDSAFTMLGVLRQLRFTVADARGNLITEGLPRTVFTSADARIASVDSTGTVRSTGEGSTRLTAAIGSFTWNATVVVQPRRAHVSCMVYAQRKRSKQSCVTNNFTLFAPREVAR